MRRLSVLQLVYGRRISDVRFCPFVLSYPCLDRFLYVEISEQRSQQQAMAWAVDHNAFDRAQLAAGVGYMNLVQVSSIVPPGAQILCGAEHVRTLAQLSEGSTLPVALCRFSSSRKGETIPAAIAVGVPQNNDTSGVIFESTVICSESIARLTAREVVKEAFVVRDTASGDVEEVSSQLTIVDRVGCVISAAVLLP